MFTIIRLLLALALVAPVLAARFSTLRLTKSNFCVQTKDDCREHGTEIVYGECGKSKTQRWVYEDKQLKLFGGGDNCIAVTREDKAVLASCFPTDNPNIRLSWEWTPATGGPLCLSKYVERRNLTAPARDEGQNPIVESTCFSAIGGQEPPLLFFSWLQRAVRFEPVRTRQAQ